MVESFKEKSAREKKESIKKLYEELNLDSDYSLINGKQIILIIRALQNSMPNFKEAIQYLMDRDMIVYKVKTGVEIMPITRCACENCIKAKKIVLTAVKNKTPQADIADYLKSLTEIKH